MFHLISYTTNDTIQKEKAEYAIKDQPELRIQRFCEVNNGNKIQNGEVQYYGTKGDKKIVVKECNYKGEEIRTTTITFEFDAQGRMAKEIRAIEGEPLDDGVRRVETINSFYTNGKISKTDVKNITDCEFDESGTHSNTTKKDI